MTPVFGCLPLLWKTRIATVQDYNILKKKKKREREKQKERDSCWALCISYQDRPVQDRGRWCRCAECVREGRSSMETWLNFHTYFWILLPKSNCLYLRWPFAASQADARTQQGTSQPGLLCWAPLLPPPLRGRQTCFWRLLVDTASEGRGLQSTSCHGTAQEWKKPHQEKLPPSAEASGHFRAVAG